MPDHVGLIVEEKEEEFLVFDNYHKLKKFRKDVEKDIVLGDYVKLKGGETLELLSTNVELYVKSGVPHVSTIATAPHESLLDKSIFEKYEGFLWSPDFGLILDAASAFDTLPSNEMFLIIVKYSPSQNVLWELVELKRQCCVEENKMLVSSAPWIIEQSQLEIDRIIKSHHSDISSRMKKAAEIKKKPLIEKRELFWGICVHSKYWKQIAIWSPSGGLILCDDKACSILEPGKWFIFGVKMSGPVGSPMVYARSFISMSPKYPTIKDNENPSVRLEFILNEEKNEDYFVDFVIGKVKLTYEFKENLKKDAQYLDKAPGSILKITGLAVFDQEVTGLMKRGTDRGIVETMCQWGERKWQKVFGSSQFPDTHMWWKMEEFEKIEVVKPIL